jgi:hypothetical protein
MQAHDRQSELEALEMELAEKEILLQTFLNADELFQKSKVILQEIKEIKNRLQELRDGNRNLK